MIRDNTDVPPRHKPMGQMRQRQKLAGQQKRTPDQRLADLDKIAEWLVQGKTQRWIGGQLGLTQQQISYDVKDVRKQWKANTDLSYEQHISRLMAEIQHVKQVYWQEYSGEGLTNEKITLKKGLTPLGESSSTEMVYRNNQGSLKALDGLLKCLDRQMKILGLDLNFAIESLTRAGFQIVDPSEVNQ